VAAVNPWVVCTLEGLLDGHLGLEAVVVCVETGTVVVRRTSYVLDVGRSLVESNGGGKSHDIEKGNQ
jgi:hypothetical protein